MDDGCNEAELDDKIKFYVTDEYKVMHCASPRSDEYLQLSMYTLHNRCYMQRQVLREMSTEQLIDTIVIHPTVTLTPSFRDTGLTSTYSFQPLSNLVYMRDQQITTAKGIVLGSLRSSQRQLEVELMQFVFRKLGTSILHPPKRRHTLSRPPACRIPATGVPALPWHLIGRRTQN